MGLVIDHVDVTFESLTFVIVVSVADATEARCEGRVVPHERVSGPAARRREAISSDFVVTPGRPSVSWLHRKWFLRGTSTCLETTERDHQTDVCSIHRPSGLTA